MFVRYGLCQAHSWSIAYGVEERPLGDVDWLQRHLASCVEKRLRDDGATYLSNVVVCPNLRLAAANRFGTLGRHVPFHQTSYRDHLVIRTRQRAIALHNFNILSPPGRIHTARMFKALLLRMYASNLFVEIATFPSEQ